MKKKIIILLIILIVVIIFLLYSLTGLKNKKRDVYINFLNNTIPDLNTGNVKILSGRENIAKISQAVKNYYNACYNTNKEMVKEILNKDYVEYMNIDIEDLMKTNSATKNLYDLEINTIYEINDKMYFANVKDVYNNVYFIGVILNDEKNKYSIFLDGIYNYSDIKKYEKNEQYDDHGDGHDDGKEHEEQEENT